MGAERVDLGPRGDQIVPEPRKSVPPPPPGPAWGPAPGFVPVPVPPTTPGRQIGGVVLVVGALAALGLSVGTWLTAGASLVEALNRGLSSHAPTTSAQSPGGDFLIGALVGSGLWGVAIALACAALAIGRGGVKVLGAVVLAGVVGFVPLALGVATVLDAVRG